LPLANPVEVGDKFFKVVLADGTVVPNSAFWATETDLAGLKGLRYDQIADRLGIPLVSQQGLKVEVVEITALRPGMTFTSIIAPTTELGANGTVWSIGKGDELPGLLARGRATELEYLDLTLKIREVVPLKVLVH
jgi:hypothetical protein